MISFFRQIWAVSAMNLAALPSRASASLVTIVGVATVVAVMLSLLGIGAGVAGSVLRNDQPDRAIVLSTGATEYMGSFSQSDIAQIAEAPGIAKSPDGKPIVQPQALIIVELENKTGGGTNNSIFRGAGPMSELMRSPTWRIVEGRTYTPGLHELIAGRRAQATYMHLGVGDTVVLRGVPWKVVGAYADNGGIDENGIVTDADTLLAAFNRSSYQSVAVQLTSPAAFRPFKDAISSNPQLQVQAKRMGDYYRDQLKGLTALLSFVGYFVGGVMAVGVVFGALNTMYSAVDARKREIATLRALGFGATAVVVSVILESLVLAIPGALLGSLVAWLLFNNHDVHMGGVSFPLSVTPELVLLGLIWALVIGLIGGLAPSIRAARLPVAEALRAT
ncbi:MAG TPA: ABC transporter permease [Caulobacteraceae bacterium]|jgi:putative ABC transport system permease protein|nr:ABC transporter permease [Caulobacteraceae bacterium]